MAVLF